jgi:diguanylate cyclase (GGDEF)-like protein/PAS domain S-box-containing protein
MAEDNVNASDEGFAALAADQLPVCIGYVDSSRRYRYANKRYCELFGMSRDEIVGRTVEQVVGEENYLAVKGHIDTVLEGRAQEFQATVNYPGLGARQGKFSYSAHRGSSGQIEGYFILVSDITESHIASEALRASEERIRLIADNVPVMISYTDADERYQFVNRVYCEWFGHAREEIVGRLWHEVVGEENAERIRPILRRALGGERVQFEDHFRMPSGRKRYMRAVHIPHREDGCVKGVFVLREDITELRETINTLRERDHQITLIADNVPAVICYVDKDERYKFINRSFQEWFGLSGENVLGRELKEVLKAGRYKLIEPFVRRAISGETVEFEEVLTLPSGEDRHAQVIYEPHIEKGEISGFYIFRTDITSLKKSEAELRHFATHDPLTNLPNRRLFEERYEHALDLAERRRETLCVLLIDLDKFKAINDQHGHQAGDIVLTAAADRLRAVCRQSDTVARLGGDEFAMLLETDATLDGAIAIAQKLSATLKQPIPAGENQLEVGASIGIAILDGALGGLDIALKMADAAMYDAKCTGKAYSVYGKPTALETANNAA